MEPLKHWNDILVEEHEWLERAIAVIDVELAKLKSDQANEKRIGRALDFLLEIGDKMHNQKEEKFLFPAMAEKGIPIDGGPIGVMIYEHEKERQLIQELSLILLSKGEQGLAANKDRFIQSMREYFQVRKEHIWKENDILYPMALRVFSETDNNRISMALHQMDKAVYGDTAREKYESMLKEIESEGDLAQDLITNLSYKQLHHIMETLPFELTFVDDKDTVAYFNRLDKEKIFIRTRSVIGRKVEKCHPERSVDKVLEIVNAFKQKTMDKAEFWINFQGKMVFIQYFPVRDEKDNYLGVLEVTSDINHVRSLTGEKRLL